MPTKKQSRKLREAENEYPEIRREDDPLYLNPKSKIKQKSADIKNREGSSIEDKVKEENKKS